MELYHGSVVVVERPLILPATRTADFGCGFYTTSSREQALAFARLRMRRRKSAVGYVSVYQADLAALCQLNALRFEKADHDWLMFVKANRLREGFDYDYDLVVGPVADDNVVDAFNKYMRNRYDERRLIEELRTYSLRDQWLFHTPLALQCLTFLRYIEVRNG